MTLVTPLRALIAIAIAILFQGLALADSTASTQKLQSIIEEAMHAIAAFEAQIAGWEEDTRVGREHITALEGKVARMREFLLLNEKVLESDRTKSLSE